MILQKEIREKAEKLEVPPTTIDKDWVLSHVLKGMYELEEIKKDMIFKGGTCLKKCYFSNYRFSEDLDFTVTNEDFIFDESMMEKLTNIVFENSGIRLFFNKIKPQKFKDKIVGFEVKINFWGANHKKNMRIPVASTWHTKIKIDANWYEEVLFPIEEKEILHDFSDAHFFKDFTIPCYSLLETMSEKLRALIQRKYTASRDYYDIWFLNQHIDITDWEKVIEIFHHKCKLKNKTFTGRVQLLNPEIEQDLKTHWNAHLAHQISPSQLKSVDFVCEHLYQLFEEKF